MRSHRLLPLQKMVCGQCAVLKVTHLTPCRGKQVTDGLDVERAFYTVLQLVSGTHFSIPTQFFEKKLT